MSFYYKIGYEGKELNKKLTYEDLLSYDMSKIYYATKYYYPVVNGKSSDSMMSMCLYTADVTMSSDEYIKNYNSIASFGENCLSEDDIKIINKFN